MGVVAGLASPGDASGFGGVPSRGAESPPIDPTTTPAYRYARLERFECEAELRRRGVPFAPVAEARGVLAPVRLTGPLHGVVIHSGIRERDRATSPFEIFDCRLVLSLDDLTASLEKDGIVELVHMSAYRPPPPRVLPEGQLGTRHGGGLAIDIGSFTRRDGSVLSVERDFRGFVGGHTCGSSASPPPAHPAAVELRRIACEAADRRLFNVLLTPHYNGQHKNHFHFEVTPRVRWFVVH